MIRIIGALGLSAVLLTGCGVTVSAGNQPAPAPHTQSAAPVTTDSDTTSDSTSSEDDFLENARSNDSTVAQLDDETLLKLGNGACDLLDQGYEFSELMDAMVSDDSVDIDFASAIIGAAVTDLCPEYQDDAQAWVDDNSYTDEDTF